MIQWANKLPHNCLDGRFDSPAGSTDGNLEAVRLLLGYSDIGSTARYLGAVKQVNQALASWPCNVRCWG